MRHLPSRGGLRVEEAAARQPALPGPASPDMRFEATVHAGRRAGDLEAVAELDLDRVPDPEGGIRLLLTAEGAAALVSRGYEVRLLDVLPVRPLDAELFAGEGATLAWLERAVQGIERHQAS